MDSQEKKLLAMCGSPNAAERANAVERLYEVQQNNNRSTTDIVAEFEQLEEDNAALSDDNEKLRRANKRWLQLHVSLLAIAARLGWCRDWIAFHRKRCAALLGVLAVGTGIYVNYGPGTGPAAIKEREAVDRAFHAMAASWVWGEGETEPHVYTLGRETWWVIARGYIEVGDHADGSGQAVEMHCIDLYVKRAVPDFGAYVKPGSRNLAEGWFSGWRKWATDCKVAATRKAEQ